MKFKMKRRTKYANNPRTIKVCMQVLGYPHHQLPILTNHQLSSRNSQLVPSRIVSNDHILIVPSKDPVAKCLPSGKKQTDSTESVWPLNGGKKVRPVIASHTCAVLSQDPERIRFPSGEKHTDLTHLSCPVIGPQTIWPLWASQTSIVLSLDPETMREPSKEYATE